MDEQKNVEFDFYGKNEEIARKKANQEKKEKLSSFLNLGRTTLISIGVAVTITGAGVIGYNMYQNNIDDKIKNAEQIIVNSNKAGVLDLIKKEQIAAQKTFTNSQLIINSFGRYKDLIEVINYGDKVAVFNTNNAKLYKQTTDSLTTDYNEVSKVYNAINGTRDQKINTFLNDESMQKFNKWNQNFKNKQFMYVGGLIELNKDLLGQLQFLDKTQRDIIKDVQNKLKNKDYNLSDAQAKFSEQVKSETKADMDDLKQAKLELQDTEDALKENGDDPNKVASLLTDVDVANATMAMSTLEKEALGQISEDKSKVESLIAKVSSTNGDLPIPSSAPTGTATQPTQAQAHTGPSFLDYYLMYAWMNTMSSSNSFANGYASGQANALTNSIAKNQSGMYSLKNDNSYLNKSLTKKADFNAFGNKANLSAANVAPVASKPNLNTLRSQINSSRARASQVRSTRSIELSRMGYSNSYEAGKSGKSSISRGVKSSVSKSSSSISRGTFGGRSGGFGG